MNHSALAHKPLARLLFVLACTLALCPAQPVRHAGFSVKDGVLLRDGKPYRAMGINVASLADDILAKGQAATESFAAIEYLGQKKIPFIRFWASYFDNWKPYRQDPQRYWRNMDLLIGACEKAHVGIVPTLFWNVWNVPYEFGEFRSAWLDPASQTRKFMQHYVREFVTRYAKRDIVWFWEFSNENNLTWDLPNSITILPEGRKDNRNIVRSYTGILAERAFAEEVRKYDAVRPISPGTSEPRPSQFHIAAVPLKPGERWGADTPEQTLEAVRWTVPAPIDLLSVHHYVSPSQYDPAAVRASIQERLDWAAQLHKPLFLGEFGIVDHWIAPPDGFDDEAYQRNLRDYFEAIYDAGVPIAAYWALTPSVQPKIGTVSPAYPRFQYVIDLIAGYNRKIAAGGQFANARQASASQTDLRGYGKVSAKFASGRAEFLCESSGKAGILQGKLLADLLWDAPEVERPGHDVDIQGRKMTVYEFPPHGAIVVGRLGSRVVALGGSDAKELAGLAAKEDMFRDPRCRFKADQEHPIYLDFFDLDAVKIYTYAMTSIRKEGFASHWPFIRKIGLNAISYNLGGGMISSKSPAPGILNYVDTDFEDREAQRNHGMIVPAISTGGALPPWATNLFPQSILKLAPTAIGEDDNTLRLLESYGMPRQEREITGLWSLRETMRRYLASPAVGGWQVFDGPAGIEITHAYQQEADFSPAGLRSFREFLRNVRGLDLRAVGLRYYNDPGHFKSWNEVMPLDANGFFGNLDDSCLLLKNWQWQIADPAAAEPPSGSDPKWRNLLYPGSDEMHTIPEADAFYRISFDATQWLAGNSARDIYLITGRTRVKKPNRMKVWLNGKYLGPQGEWDLLARSRSAAVKVDGVLHPGSNELKLWIPNGKLLSPFFLTTHRPEEYPSSDKTLNARFVDLKDWQYDQLGARHRDAFALARGIDPNRSFILPAGGAWELAGEMADIARDMGSSLQNTGREAFYQPWWARLGRVAGFYGSSEPSATTTADPALPASLQRMFGWILIDGDASNILYWILEDYIRIERETGWLTRNKRLLSLVGKSLPRAPEIVVFRSSDSMRYSSDHYNNATWHWDIARGDLNAAHYNWGYASERELRRGLPKTCKVLFDSGSEVMNQSTVDAIASFVSEGGIFVALHNTGRHRPLEANTWPISRLTGFKVTGEKTAGKIRFESGLSVFKGWDGRELESGGIALQAIGAGPDGEETAGKTRFESGLSVVKGRDGRKLEAGGVALQAIGAGPDEVKILARWDDGSAAVTSRTLGKGRVICLGSAFWRKLATLERLFTDLGVERTSDASSPDIWLNDSIAKNGLENWLIAFNNQRDPKTADLKFRVGAKPLEVRDLIAGKTVPFGYSDGWIQLKDVQFGNTETRVFAVKRANLVDGLSFWWAEKTTYWKKSAVPVVKDEPRDAGKLGTFKIDSWKFLADRDGKVSMQDAWTSSQFDDRSWSAIETGPWNSLKDELRDYTGIGLYRKSFTIPAAWKGSSISLNLYGDRSPALFGDAEFFVNGRKIDDPLFQQDLKASSYAARIVLDGDLSGKGIVLAVKIKGGAQLAGEAFNGFGGSVYLAAEKPLRPALDLGGQWTLARQDGSSTAVSFPASKAAGKFIAKDFQIPTAWAGRDVYFRLETETPWLTGIMVNGKLLLPAQFRKMGRYVEWNIAEWVEPGKRVRVELWGNTLPLYQRNGSDPKKPPPDIKMDLLFARVGCIAQ